MTIILSCLTPEYIVQVSDRRISIPRLRFHNGRLVREYTPRDDITNKAILWNGTIALSYTGLGEIAGMPTDIWITQTLAKFPTHQEGLEGLRDEATSYFQKFEPYHPQQGFLAIIGIGWSHPATELHGLPFLFLISNFHDSFHTTGFRQNEFQIWAGSFNEGHNLILHVTGQPLLKNEYFNVKRYLQTVLKKRLSPMLITELLSKTIRKVADRNNTVGKNLMVISLPKQKPNLITLPNGKQAAFIPFSQPTQNHSSFYYISDENERIEYGPNVVNPGNYVTNYVHEFIGEEESISFIPGFNNLK